MDEAMMMGIGEGQDQVDAFLSGVEDEPELMEAESSENGTEGAGEIEAEAPEGREADQLPPEEGRKPAEETEEPTQTEDRPTAGASWHVKHMGQERTMTAGEITPELLQKGLDYDRVRERYDEAKPVMEMFAQFAQRMGMTVPDYVKYIRAETMKANGMSEAEAKRTVELEDREAAVAAQEAKRQSEQTEQQQKRARVDADVAEFARAFPEVFEQAKNDPKTIPQSVWDEVNAGLSLTAAYSRYAVAQAQAQTQQARAQVERARKNEENTQRATGSLKSAGSESKGVDPFMAGFED